MHILSGKSEYIDRSTRREREMCVLFEFRQFLTPRTHLRILKFHVYLSYEMSLSDCITL